ncbi:hypothetical protein NBRC10513v2_006829 [Rhodotorula toruloides]
MAPTAATLATLLVLVSLLATHSLAQSTCSNYGTLLSNGTCDCPPGFDPATSCTLAACDNPLESNFARQPFSAVLAGNASTGCARQCTSGFVGPNCNVCTENQACASALQSVSGGGGGAGSSSNGMSLTNGLGEPVCSTGPWTWTEGFASCDVVNPTLQSVFSGFTTLTIQKTVSPTQSLSSPFGTNGTMTAQLWYAPLSGNTTVIEQFFCAAEECAQTNTTTGNAGGEVDWSCQNLRCTCIPGTTFCGAPGSALDLTSTIDGLSGPLDITCDAATGTMCAFKQDVLKTLFGANGLSLSGCRWGECVLPGTVSALADALAGKGPTGGGGGGGLSGGVIAGLAVLGGVVGALLVLLALGKASQRRARRKAREEDEKVLLVASAGAATLHSGAGGSCGSASSSSHQDTSEKPIDSPPSSLPAIGLEWSNLSYTLPPTPRFSLLPSSSSSAPREGKQILSSLSARVEPGSFVSILGPSGAGKSTLVDLLAGVRKSGKREGRVELVNLGGGEGEEVRIGYVDQADELPQTSTVREAVMLAAELKLGEIPHEKKRDRVFEVLTQLGLLDVADSIIGSPEGSGTRGISGGERRRVSIALELVARPAVLIADEPTSGLDSTSALRILTALKALTLPSPSPSSRPTRRTTVICTIHQPSSQLYHLFDDVLLLAQGGTQLWFGKAGRAREWWEGKGVRCPEGWNPADFLLDLATSPPAAFLPLRPSPTTRKSATSLPSSPPHTTPELPYTSTPSSRPFLPTPRSLLRNTNAHQRASRKPTTTAMTQVEVLAKREARNLVRDKGLVLMHNVVPTIVGLFVGGMFYKVNLTIGGFQSRVGALFFLGCLIAFASLSALSNFAHAKRIFIRERARGYYSPVTWLASKLVFDIVPLRLVPTIVLATIV